MKDSGSHCKSHRAANRSTVASAASRLSATNAEEGNRPARFGDESENRFVSAAVADHQNPKRYFLMKAVGETCAVQRGAHQLVARPEGQRESGVEESRGSSCVLLYADLRKLPVPVHDVFYGRFQRAIRDHHVARTPAGLAVRIAQRILALTIGILVNRLSGPPARALAAYDGR